jgi:hypothetical protein
VRDKGQSDPPTDLLGSCQKGPFLRPLHPASALTPIKGDPDLLGQAARALTYHYCRKQTLGPWVGRELTTHRGNPQVATLNGPRCPLQPAGSCEGGQDPVTEATQDPDTGATRVPVTEAAQVPVTQAAQDPGGAQAGPLGAETGL